MEHHSREQLEYVLNYVKRVFESRELKQTTLAADSSVEQSTISRLFNGHLEPSAELLRKLCRGLGTNFEEVVHSPQQAVPFLLGYLATPLTGLTDRQDVELRKLVAALKECSGPEEFTDPRFELYWPGDYTHPKANPEHTPEQVYRKDRAFASTYNFLILLCLTPSYGVGQENEIATQAGNPAIRFIPATVSRMLKGSLLHAVDMTFTGSLDAGIQFNREDLKRALQWVQQNYFLQLPLYRGANGHEFGHRLGDLLDQRVSNRSEFAAKLGVAEQYLEVLVSESVVVANPSMRLLKRLGALLGVTVGYLLGESKDADPVWVDSHSSWRSWIRTPGIDAGLAFEIKEEWEAEYVRRTGQQEFSSASHHRSEIVAQTTKDWDVAYQKCRKVEAAIHNGQRPLF